MLLVFIGPPGSGKGTQARRLVERYRIPHLSTGELLRSAKRLGSDVGREAAKYMDAGKLVPDGIVLDMVEEQLARPEFSRGCLFDGFPRTVQQAESLDRTLAQRGTPLTRAIALEAEEGELVRRMLDRARQEGRADDTPQTIGQRLEVYRRQTAPLVEYYRAKGVLAFVDAMGTPDEVFQRICEAIEAPVPPATQLLK